MPFGTALRSVAILLALPLLFALLSAFLGQIAPYLGDGTLVARTFGAVGENWLLVAIFSLIINVARAAIAEGGSTV